MSRIRFAFVSVAFATGQIVLSAVPASSPARAAAQDYRFELVGKPQASGGKDRIDIRLVHLPDGKPVADAVVFDSKADMGPMGMPTMAAPVRLLQAGKPGIYSFEIESAMTGTWAIRLAAKVQGEPETVRGTVTADLVK